jgi:ribonucleotide reductase alpha subunit/predicted RNA-binding Zn-ribbon protein involved in translation (DUF1610 family)
MESDIVENILKERYYQPGETCWGDIAKRVANFVGSDETERGEFYKVINDKLFIPNSPCLMNAGAKEALMSACFSIGIDDDLGSIFDAVKRGALLMKAGAGVGYDFSTLRPKDALIRNGQGTASGVVSFMKVFNSMIGEVKSGFKRRGAAISILRCDHPEIFEFIKCKDNEGEFSNFNISVMITNEFLDAVKNNLSWDLKFNDKIYETVNAKELFDEMVNHTHRSGEPGYLHYDNINNANPNKQLGNITSCNPCVTGDTKILTKEYGYQPIADFVDKEIEIWNGFEWSIVTPKVTGYDQKIITIEVIYSVDSKFNRIGVIDCTPYHKFILKDGTRVEAKDLTIHDELALYYLPDGAEISCTVNNIKDFNFVSPTVYCLNEPKNHSFVANGVMVGNCGEIPILVDPKTNGGESCNLGSIDVSKFFDEYQVDSVKLEKVVRLATRFLNNVMDKNTYPFDSIRDMTLNTRKIGIGCMGVADLLIKMNMIYGSKESCEFCEKLMKFINDIAIDESQNLAKMNGVYPAWKGSEWEEKGIKLKNSVLTCQAPTGCQKPDTLILTNEGILKLSEIGNINGDKWQDISLNIIQETKETNASRFYSNGESKTKIITLYSGIELECTLNHKYRCLTSENKYIWKHANDIVIGDRLVSRIGGYIKNNEPDLIPVYRESKHSTIIKLPDEMSPLLAEFVGILIGNGSFHKKGIRLHFNHEHIEKHDYVIKMIKDLFGLDVKKYKEHTCTSIYLSSIQVKNWLITNGLHKTYSRFAQIPEIIRRSSVNSLKGFLKGLIFADGSHNGNSVYIDTSSKQLSQQLMVCMRSIGIFGRIITYTNVKGRMSKNPSYRIYYNRYPSMSYPEEKVHYAPKHIRKDRDDAKSIHETLFCEEVVNVSDGYTNTYDIEVPEDNYYIANSVISHNTCSLFAGCSSGIEPNFGYVYKRSTWVDGEKKTYTMLHPLFEEYIKNEPYAEQIKQYALEHGTIQGFNSSDKNLDKFIVSKDISWKEHTDIQIAFQKYTGNSISKTVNCPNNFTTEELSKLLFYAFDGGCKGLTIYREGSRKDVVLETNATKKDESKVVEITNPVQYKLATANGRILPKTPRDMPATVHKRTTACGKLYVIPAEAFDQLHSLFLVNKGGCDAMTQVIAELIGSMCRFGIPRWEITRICSGIICPACRNKRKFVDGNSCADIIARVILENYPVDEEPPKCIEEPTEDTTEIVTINKVPCPKCGESLIMQEGCRTCPSCGYSRCS